MSSKQASSSGLNCSISSLDDVYGPRRLVSNGDLPAALLFANPAFLRPLAGLAAPQRCHLHLLGVDLARSPDGRWWVLADRTQAPSGTGYALQNRTIVADALPEAFRTANVRRLASFFRAQREVLLGLGAVRSSARGSAHARTIQRNLLRAFLPGAVSRIHSG